MSENTLNLMRKSMSFYFLLMKPTATYDEYNAIEITLGHGSLKGYFADKFQQKYREVLNPPFIKK